jgi:hypothetical protein
VTDKRNWPLLHAGEDSKVIVRGFTITWKLWVALKPGEPLSATFSVIKLVVLALLTNGRGVVIKCQCRRKSAFFSG